MEHKYSNLKEEKYNNFSKRLSSCKVDNLKILEHLKFRATINVLQ